MTMLRIDKPRVLITTEHVGLINDFVRVIIKDAPFIIQMREDPYFRMENAVSNKSRLDSEFEFLVSSEDPGVEAVDEDGGGRGVFEEGHMSGKGDTMEQIVTMEAMQA